MGEVPMSSRQYNPNTNKEEFVLSFNNELTRKIWAKANASGKSPQAVIREMIKTAFVSEEEKQNENRSKYFR
ncbi:hypothetical protein AS658_13945 [Serratia marcescens]|nr:hypothetical protein AM681_14095 [Serratia marcescens]AVU40787.1 hypothetical protein AS658_13945 [Serratia marcescens]